MIVNFPVNILFIMFRSFGDVVMSTGVIRALKKKYPESTISYITSTNCVDILVGNPDIHAIYSERDYIEPMNFDIVFSPFMVTQSRGEWWQYHRSMMDLYADGCGVELKNKLCYLYPADINHLKIQHSIPDEYILIQTKTRDVTKDYTRWDELIALINERLGIPIIQIGGKDDPIAKGIALNLCNKISFRESANLIKDAHATITLDSVVAHIAGAVGGKRIILYGATNFELCGSGDDFNNVAINLAMRDTFILEPEKRLPDCNRACFKSTCPVPCINNIEPEEIVKLL